MALDLLTVILATFLGFVSGGCVCLYLLREVIADEAMHGKLITSVLDMVDSAFHAFVIMIASLYGLSLPYLVFKEIERRSTTAKATKDHKE